MYYDSTSDHLNESRQNDSRLNESSASALRPKRKRTLEDYEFVLNENSKYQTSELGKGAYGVVKKVKDKKTGKVYAMKIMSKKAIFEYSNKDNLKREINIQKMILHPHIVRLYTYFEDNENVYLILEYAENGSLFHYIRKKKKFLENEAFVYFFQTCLGIDYLHKRDIIHRDLKPENLLLDEEGNIKICDFGWSAETSLQRATFCGTIDYMAPEMIKNHPHDHRLDIWSLGVLLYEMLHGYAPFKGRSDQEKTMNITMNRPMNFDPTISPEAVDLIRKILQPAPINRISMREIFEHPWMKKSEKTYGIDINSYVVQQDEQIRELKRAENNKSMMSHQSSFNTDIVDRSIDSGIQMPQVTKQMSSGTLGRSSGHSGKIITIQDNASPLILTQKISYEDHKKLSYNGSTKASESSSIGSRPGTNGLNIEQLLKEHATKSQEKPVVNSPAEVPYRKERLEVSRSQQFSSEYLNNLVQSSDLYSTSQHFGREVEKKQSLPTRYDFERDAFKRDAADGHINRVYTQKQKSVQIDSPDFGGLYSGNKLYSSDRKERRPYYETSYRDKKVEGRPNSIEKLYRSDMKNDRNRYGRLNSAYDHAIYEEDDDGYGEFQRLSKISMKNREISKYNKPYRKEQKEVGFFEKILVGLGCIARDAEKIPGKKYQD